MQDNAIRKGEPWMVQTLQLPASHDALDFPLRATWSQKHFIGYSCAVIRITIKQVYS